MSDTVKRAIGDAAAQLIENGMRIGLGTGSTTAFALEAIGTRIRKEGLDVAGTPTSYAAERLARAHGIPLFTLDEVEILDMAIDGADEVDTFLNLIKGRGAAHTREKVVASLARRFVVLADESKRVEVLGTHMPLPVEVLPMAVSPIMRQLEKLGAQPELRMGNAKDGPVVTDQGFWVVDAHFDGIEHPERLNDLLCKLPGILDHGLFLDMATDLLLGRQDGTVSHEQKSV